MLLNLPLHLLPAIEAGLTSQRAGTGSLTAVSSTSAIC